MSHCEYGWCGCQEPKLAGENNSLLFRRSFSGETTDPIALTHRIMARISDDIGKHVNGLGTVPGTPEVSGRWYPEQVAGTSYLTTGGTRATLVPVSTAEVPDGVTFLTFLKYDGPEGAEHDFYALRAAMRRAFEQEGFVAGREGGP